MTKEPGRNDPCPCGAIKQNGRRQKYKHCHLKLLNDGVMRAITSLEEERQQALALRQKGIFINYVRPVIFKGKKVWALGNRIYHSRDANETFHDFIQFILKETLGFDWIKNQLLLGPDKRHFLVTCFQEFETWKKMHVDNLPEPRPQFIEAAPNGYTKSMLTLAFDIATLKHASNLPESLIGRLRNRETYQGARYEVTVAGIMARLGFSIQWIDDSRDNKPHCEFLAVHDTSGIKIAVEAKSRHRQGVLHRPGVPDDHVNSRGDVQHLVDRALKKSECGQMPFIVFIDVNTKFSDAENFTEIPWITDVLQIARSKKPVTQENPAAWNAVYFTNFSTHYQTDEEASPGQYLQSLPQFVMHDIPDKSLFPAILTALKFYGDIPDVATR